MALSVAQYEEIASILHEVPRLVDDLEARRADFPGRVLAWLKRAERALEDNRLPACSRVAAWRAALLQAGRGVQHPDVRMLGRPTVRKLLEATACMALEHGNDLLHTAVGDREGIFQEAERIAQQLLAVIAAKGLLDGRSASSHQERLLDLQQRVASDRDLAAVYAHLVSLVGSTDVLVFFDRALPKVS